MSSSFPLREWRVRMSGASDTGKKRSQNEDRWGIFDEEPLMLVADGMGGHAAGEIAAALAVDTLQEYFRITADFYQQTWPLKTNRSKQTELKRLRAGIQWANQRIFEASQASSQLKGMGTTVVAALFCEDVLWFCHVGDSRLYRLRGTELVQLTEDHSLRNEYYKNPMGPTLQGPPARNILLRALGVEPRVAIEVNQDIPQWGDTYLLCSDGLSEMVSAEQMVALINSNDPLESICDQLIDLANDNGGEDNCTVVLARIEDL